ncbi:MAG: DUF1761 domain-containing protein [Bacteroidota bacterium]
MLSRINWWAVLVSTVVGIGLGFLWYGVLFLQTWASGNYITMNEETEAMYKNGEEVAMSNAPMIVNALAMAVYALLMTWIIDKMECTDWGRGAIIGAIVGLFPTINVFVSNLFAINPVSLSLVDGSYTLVLFTVMGAIIGGWRKS